MFESDPNSPETDAQSLGGLGETQDTGKPVEQAGFDELSFVPPDQLESAYRQARQTLSQKGQEVSELRQQLAAMQQKQAEMTQLLQDPEALAQLAQYSQRRQAPSGAPDLSKVAEKLNLDTDMAKVLYSFMEELGVLTAYDPRVLEFQSTVQGLRGQTVQSQFQALAKQYPGAEQYQAQALDLAQKTGLDLETSLIAVSKGAVVKKAVEAEMRTKSKAAAQVAPASPQSIPSGRPTQKLSPLEAFRQAAKESRIDLNKLGELKRTHR